MSRETVPTRKAQILAAAYNIAKEKGLAAVTQSAVSRRLGVTRPLVVKYYKVDDLQSAVVAQALHEKHLVIVAQGLAARIPSALDAPDCVKEAAVKSFLN